MMTNKQNNDFFGVPRKGIHSYRIPLLDISVVDTALTFFAAYYVQKNYYKKTPLLNVFLGLMVLGIIVHKLFAVDTKINKTLFN